jgi:hypothetical protein
MAVPMGGIPRARKKAWAIALLKGGVLVLLVGTLYGQLFQQDRLALLWATFLRSVSPQNAWMPLLAGILMPLNWLLEAQKWRALQSKVAPIGLADAWRGVWAGVTISLFTPNRMGDYAGKILVAPRQGRSFETVLCALLSNFGQMVAILVSGALGGLVFCAQHRTLLGLETGASLLLATGLVGLAVVPLVLYFGIRRAVPLLRRLPFFGPWADRLAVLQRYRARMLRLALGLSLLRYGIYSLQYYLLLCFFGIALSPAQAFPAIALIYLLQTGIPLPPLTALAARGGIALMVWGIFTENELAVLSATFGLWLLNVIVPALFGALYIFQIGDKKEALPECRP